MADIQFEEEQQQQRPLMQPKRKPFFVRLVLATGVVSTEKAAEYVLLGIAVFGLCLAAIVLWEVSLSSSAPIAKPLPNQQPQQYPARYYQPGGATVPIHGT
ncbi:MAG: hypothetical protein ACYCPH_01785 [Minisyncoccota bacterium]